MNVIAFPSRGDARAVLHSHDPDILQTIKSPGIAAAIWERKPLPGFLDWIGALPARNLPRLRTLVPVGAVEPCVQSACDLAGIADGAFRDLLASDLAALSLIMAEVMASPMLHLRLEVITTNSCRRFHIDNMTARMLCTYRGRGTQLAQVGREDWPQQISTGSVTLLRGTRWPQETTRLLHRSPPIEGTGETRLLAVIDPAGDYRVEGG